MTDPRRVVRVAAPSRLHFGLWSLGIPGDEARQFGGVGAMVQQPGLRLSIFPDSSFSATGPLATRAAATARRWCEFQGRDLPHVRIQIESAPPEHVGLGTGTQLALAVAAGLNAASGLPSQTPQELALSVGRGLRSAVGTYGFVLGGLVVEQGKLLGERISPLDCRIDLPDAWRFVLVRHTQAAGLSGEDEAAAMASLPTVPAAVTERLVAEVRERLVPAAATADFATFAASLYDYGRLSGQCFAARQGGPYKGPVLTALVGQIRHLGFAGVGQSSWGPTLFVAAESSAAADSLVQNLQREDTARQLQIQIAQPCNAGARIESLPLPA